MCFGRFPKLLFPFIIGCVPISRPPPNLECRLSSIFYKVILYLCQRALNSPFAFTARTMESFQFVHCGPHLLPPPQSVITMLLASPVIKRESSLVHLKSKIIANAPRCRPSQHAKLCRSTLCSGRAGSFLHMTPKYRVRFPQFPNQ